MRFTITIDLIKLFYIYLIGCLLTFFYMAIYKNKILS